MTTIDVSDLDQYRLIKALWSNMKPASFFNSFTAMTAGLTPPNEPSNEEIDRTFQSGKYIDYLAGRCIKTDFNDLTSVNTRLYNRDAGEGAFERIVESLRNSK